MHDWSRVTRLGGMQGAVGGRGAGGWWRRRRMDAEGDEASHTFFRPSSRRFIEDHREGAACWYFNYGMHWMLNVLVKGGARTGFVLIPGARAADRHRRDARARGKTDPAPVMLRPGEACAGAGSDGSGSRPRPLCGSVFRFSCRDWGVPRSSLRLGWEFPRGRVSVAIFRGGEQACERASEGLEERA